MRSGEPLRARRIDRRAGRPIRCGNTLSSTDFTRRHRLDAGPATRLRATSAGEVAWPRLSGAGKSAELPQPDRSRVRAAEDKKAEDITVLDLRKRAGFTDHFVDLLGHQRAADSRDRRRDRRGAGRSTESRRTSKATTAPIDPVDPHRLLRLHRARLRARDARSSTISSGSGAAPSAWHDPRPRPGLARAGRSPPATTYLVRRPRGALRGVRRTLDHPTLRSGLRRAAGSRSRRSPPRSVQRCGDPLASWRVSSAPLAHAAPAAAAAGRSSTRAGAGAYDGASRDRARAELTTGGARSRGRWRR